MDGLDLLFGSSDDARINPVQQKPNPAKPRMDGLDLLFGDGKDDATKQRTAMPGQDPNAEPDAQTTGGWIAQQFRGKRDKRYDNLPVYSGHDVFSTTAGNVALAAGAQDDDFTDIIKKDLGPRFIRSFKDANGTPIVEYHGKDGKPVMEYVNKPGVDMTDVGRGIASVIPYVPGAAAVGGLMKTAPLLAQGAGQAAAAMSVNAGAQVARQAAGSDQSINPAEIVTTGAAAYAGPLIGAGFNKAISPLWSRFVTVPGLINNATGDLTEKGLAAAKRAGLDPADFTPEIAREFAKALAQTGDDAAAGVAATTKSFGIPVTKGQLSKDPYQLTQEEAMRRRIFGSPAQNTMRDFDEQQAAAIKSVALGGDDASPFAIAPMLNKGRSPATQSLDGNPAELGQSVRSAVTSARDAAKAGEREAWESVPAMTPTDETLAELPGIVSASVGRFPISKEMTPAAARMGSALDDFMAGTNPEPIAGVFKRQPKPNADEMRRQLLAISQSAENNTDREAARLVYNGFNDWIDATADKMVGKGDLEGAAKLRIARGYTREMKQTFAPTGANGRPTPAAQRLEKILDTDKVDSAEGVINSLFGSQGSKSVAPGTVDALNTLKTVLIKQGDDVSLQAWNDIRLAYWLRQVQGKNGEILGPTALMNNLKTVFQQQKSVVDALYTPVEQKTMRRFIAAMERVSFKPPNASGSGYTAVSLTQTLLGKVLGSMLDKVGANSTLVKGAAEISGVQNMAGSVAARSAVSPRAPTNARGMNYAPVAPLIGATNALASPSNRNPGSPNR